MYNTNVTQARANLYKLIDMTIEDGEMININTKKGNAVIISEADYNALIETLYLSSNPDIKKSIIDGINTSIDECIDEGQVEW
ncbi:MAG: type II toxin-antitoxin system Phd/YefM family antitoxin [Clostridia bacterium]|nr:type II toxin-antitoxin system Phd/YefM family antitoxin [Clostridia bacterium]